MFGGSTRELFSSLEIGPSFSRLGAKYACVIELDRDATADKMSSNEAVTVVKAWWPSRETGIYVTNILTSLARGIQTRNEQRWRAVKEERVSCHLLLSFSVVLVRSCEFA